MKGLLEYLAVRFLTGFMRVSSFSMYRRYARLAAFVLHRLIRYRRTVALDNLHNAFPDLNPIELRKLLGAVYLNLADVFFETVKAFTTSQERVQQNIIPPDSEQLAHFQSHFRGAILVTAHVANWEWCGYCLTSTLQQSGSAVYKPLKNAQVDQFVRSHRMASQMQLVAMQDIVKKLASGGGASQFVYLIADQSPNPEHAQWEMFFGRSTPFFKGPGMLAHRYDLPVYFVYVERLRRQHYQMFLEPLCPDPATVTPEEINRRYITRLEAQIRKHPAQWLWTHRRWKHTPPANTA